jgi:hypothetical protein
VDYDAVAEQIRGGFHNEEARSDRHPAFICALKRVEIVGRWSVCRHRIAY